MKLSGSISCLTKRHMHKLTLFFLVISISAVAQHAGYTEVKDIADFKSKFTATSAEIKSLKSDFIQEKNLSMLSDKIMSEGKFWYKRETMVRMEYIKPFQYLVIINKNNVTTRDGQKTNTVSVKSNKLFQQITRIIVDCVQGTAFNNPDFKINVFQNAGNYLIEMKPVSKALKDFFNAIEIHINKKDYSVTSINMIEQSGDNTLLTFSNRILNSEINDSVFMVH
jgi:outer membrane lipoprotein-sorting protein